MNEKNAKIYQSFGPRIGKFKISEKLIEEINVHIDTLSKKKEIIARIRYG